MAFVKTTWVDNSVPAINAAQLNRIETGIDALHRERDDVCQVTHSASQSASAAGPLTLGFDTEIYDPSDLHTGGGNANFVARKKGLYIAIFTGHSVNPVGSGDRFEMSAWRNRVGQADAQVAQADTPVSQYAVSFAFPIYCLTNDIIYFQLYTNPSANGIRGGNTYSPHLLWKLIAEMP